MSIDAVFQCLFPSKPLPASKYRPDWTALPRHAFPSGTALDVNGRIAPMLQPRRLLDYGCGNGRDVRAYRSGFWQDRPGDVVGYDPALFPDRKRPSGTFDLITSIAVLNVLLNDKLRLQMLRDLSSFAHRDTVLVLATRDDSIDEEAAVSGAHRRWGDGYLIEHGERGGSGSVTLQRGFVPEEVCELLGRVGWRPMHFDVYASTGGFALAFRRKDYRGPWTDQPFLQQGSGTADCLLYALANAARWYGKRTPDPSSAAWRRLVRDAHGEDGPLLNKSLLLDALGLRATPLGKRSIDRGMPRGKQVRHDFSWDDQPWPQKPVVVSIRAHACGGALHCCLWVGEYEGNMSVSPALDRSGRGSKKVIALLNADVDQGPLLKWQHSALVELPREPNSEAWVIDLAGRTLPWR